MRKFLRATWRVISDSFFGSFFLEVMLPLFVIMALFFLSLMLLMSSFRWAPKVPICPEDHVFVGGGNYDRGYWDYLYCKPADG